MKALAIILMLGPYPPLFDTVVMDMKQCEYIRDNIRVSHDVPYRYSQYELHMEVICVPYTATNP